MKKYLWLLMLFPLCLIGEEQLDCDKAITTIEINLCVTKEVNRAYLNLENYLNRAKERYSSEKTIIDTLNNSQKAWLAYRKAHCDGVYEQWSGGTIRGAMFGACMLRLTKLRTHVIWQDYLTHMDSTEPLLPEPPL